MRPFGTRSALGAARGRNPESLGLVQFLARQPVFHGNRWPKIWTCPVLYTHNRFGAQASRCLTAWPPGLNIARSESREKLPTMKQILALSIVILLIAVSASADGSKVAPYIVQVEQQRARLDHDSAAVRSGAVEALGFLRACAAEPALVERLRRDTSSEVRCQAAMALAWCGGRRAVPPLLEALGDRDWLTAQAAAVALSNLTGMEFPFDAAASEEQRSAQARRWRDWWATVPGDEPPADVLELLGGAKWLAGRPLPDPAAPRSTRRRSVTASTTYKGPPGVLVDGYIGPEYWQTKNVEPPQSCTVDLGQPTDVHRVIVHQYGEAFVMTGYELAASLDGASFETIERHQGETPVTLVIDFPEQRIRFLRITSMGAKNPTYPTTFFEIEINRQAAVSRRAAPASALRRREAWREERGLRALGALGGRGATDAVLAVLGPQPSTEKCYRPTVRAGIRSLGRLREEQGFAYLVGLLDNPFWARAAAEALGDFGDPRAVPALLAAYPRYAKDLQGVNPAGVPRDDKMGFPSEDRMLETPYWIAYSLCRLMEGGQDANATTAALRAIGPQIMANLPGDHDTFFLYEPEVGHLLTRHLLELAGLRQEAAEQAFAQLGQPRRVAAPPGELAWSQFPPYRISSWLPCVCTEREDLPRLLALLEHPEGWVRLNAAKAMAWLGDPTAVEPLANMLTEAKAEAEYGFNGTFKNEEFNDPAPRWREGLIRALGILGAHEHTGLLVSILNDERSVAEVRLAAARALDDLGSPAALDALQQAAPEHPIFEVRRVAGDALRKRGMAIARPRDARQPSSCAAISQASTATAKADHPAGLRDMPAVVFIKGSNDIPNTKGTVEQADRWRQTYVVTDSGPAYRPGRNLYVLRPPRPDGDVVSLTRFEDGYVAEPEMSWDATHVIFARRGQDDPWWQIYRINVDGTGLRQLTFGPFHHVGPAYLPDGRIVLATTRSGIRDEYHGYPCTVMSVMNADGSDLQPIATNIGRDNEPALLADGRLAFSRLEVFYSRNKTELTLHAAHLDGTLDAVLYGPERRTYWRQLNHGPRTPADGQENPLTHRVLRMTQPQPMPDGRHVVVVTQGGLALVGTRRDREEIITPNNAERAYTTPLPLPDGTVLCASTRKTPDRAQVDLGLYLFDPATRELELVYNDPGAADFEARPVWPRRPPPLRPARAERGAYRGRLLCTSVFATQEREAAERGRMVRLIEGVPQPARHSTHTNPWTVWKNHGGTFARVLGTAPLAADGSFYVEVPADRLMHFQVLDSDRRVVGNQLTWIYARPGETKSCVGCHENPHTTTRGNDPLASHYRPLDFLPRGDEFTYRAKAWFKGHLPGEIEERTRTVRAVNLLGRQ